MTPERIRNLSLFDFALTDEDMAMLTVLENGKCTGSDRFPADLTRGPVDGIRYGCIG